MLRRGASCEPALPAVPPMPLLIDNGIQQA
jgi:hypothetical protein